MVDKENVADRASIKAMVRGRQTALRVMKLVDSEMSGVPY